MPQRHLACSLASTRANWPSRLEAATSRLEDIATSTDLPEDLSTLGQPAPSVPDPSAASKGPRGSHLSPSEPLPESIEEFDVFLSSSVDKYAKLSKQLGGVVAQQVRVALRLAYFSYKLTT